MIQSSATKKKASAKHKLPVYPADHKVGMKVPEGGSCCAKCKFVDGKYCANKNFEKWNGSDLIPAPTNEYCCDFFEAAKKDE